MRITATVDDKASKPIRDIHDAWLRLQRDGQQGLIAGIAAAGSIQAFNLAGQAIGQVTDFLKGSVQAAIEDEASVKKLTTALNANAPAWGANAAAIEERIAAGEALAFSDDEIRASLTSLVGATHDVSKALDIQNTAMDLARFKGISLQEASDALVKIEAGRFKGLAALGIQLKANATQEEAIAAVQRVAAGQAQAFGDTTAGAMQAASIAVNELQEDIGKELAPAIKDAANLLRTELIPAIRDAANIASQAAPIFKAMAEAVGLIGRGPSDEVKHAAEVYGDLLKVGRDANGVWDESSQAAAVAAQRAAADADALGGLTGTTAEFGRVTELARDQVNGLRGAIDDLPTSKTIEINVDINSQFGRSGAVNKGLPAGSADTERGSTFIPGGDQAALDQANAGARTQKELNDKAAADAKAAADKAAREAEAARRKAQQAADEARRKAEADARALAQAQIDAGNRAFDNLARAAHKYFDDLHTANLKAIQDAKDRADAEIEAQKKANNAAVDALTSRFDAIKAARQLSQLQSDVANAQTPEDKQRAEQALSDFLVQQEIDRRRGAATEANAKLDAEKAAKDAAFDAQKAAENDRHAAQVSAFDLGLDELRKYLSKHPAEWAKYTKLVTAALKAAGVDYTAAGRDNANAYLDGVRSAFGGVTSGGARAAASSASATIGGSDVAHMGTLAGLTNVGGGPVGDVYLNGEKVGQFVLHYLGQTAGVYSPSPVSTGSTQ